MTATRWFDEKIGNFLSLTNIEQERIQTNLSKEQTFAGSKCLGMHVQKNFYNKTTFWFVHFKTTFGQYKGGLLLDRV